MGRRSATRAPETVSLDGFIIEAYVSMNDLPSMTYTRPRRIRHVTRSATSPSPPPPADDDSPVDPNSPPCSICLTNSNPHNVLSCASCAKPFHAYCLNPPLRTLPAKGVWTCPFCKNSTARKSYKHRKVFELRNVLDKHPDLCTKEYLQDVVHTTATIARTAVNNLATEMKSETTTVQRRGTRRRGKGPTLVQTETESDNDDDEEDDDYENDPDFDLIAASSPTQSENLHSRSPPPPKRRLTRTLTKPPADPANLTSAGLNTKSTPKWRTRRSTTIKRQSVETACAASDASKLPTPKSSSLSSPLLSTTKPLSKKRNYIKSATSKPPSAVKEQPESVANNAAPSNLLSTTVVPASETHAVKNSPTANKDIVAIGQPSIPATPKRQPKTSAPVPVTHSNSHLSNLLVTPTSASQSAAQSATPPSANRSAVTTSAANSVHKYRNNTNNSPALSHPLVHTAQPAQPNTVSQHLLPARAAVNIDEKGQALFTLASNMQQSNFSSSPHIRPPNRPVQKLPSRAPVKNSASIEVIDLDDSDDDVKPTASPSRHSVRIPSSSAQPNYNVSQGAPRQQSFSNVTYAPLVNSGDFPVPQGRVDTQSDAPQSYTASGAYAQTQYAPPAPSARPLHPVNGVHSAPLDAYTSHSTRPGPHSAYPVPSANPGTTYPNRQIVSNNSYTYSNHRDGSQFVTQSSSLHPPLSERSNNSLPPPEYRPAPQQYAPSSAYADAGRVQTLPSMATSANANHWTPASQQQATYLHRSPPPHQQSMQPYPRAPPPLPQHPSYVPAYPAPSSQRGSVYPRPNADVYCPPPPGIYPPHVSPAAPTHLSRDCDPLHTSQNRVPPPQPPPVEPSTAYQQPYSASAYPTPARSHWPSAGAEHTTTRDDASWPRSGDKRPRALSSDYTVSGWQPQRHRRIDAVLTPAVRRNQFNQGRALASLAGAPTGAQYVSGARDESAAYSYEPQYASSRTSDPMAYNSAPSYAPQTEQNWGNAMSSQRVLPPPNAVRAAPTGFASANTAATTVAFAGGHGTHEARTEARTRQGALPHFEQVGGNAATGRVPTSYGQVMQRGPLPRIGSQRDAYSTERMSESQALLNQQRGVPEGGLPSVSHLLRN